MIGHPGQERRGLAPALLVTYVSVPSIIRGVGMTGTGRDIIAPIVRISIVRAGAVEITQAIEVCCLGPLGARWYLRRMPECIMGGISLTDLHEVRG